ncbi:MAG TPA: TonB-dependent receptor plug domain-containing protein, partial [Brevundimonas sp.]|nr:TonB-dependent receptor plug domain-containing protein [Brevundimonas sp.]
MSLTLVSRTALLTALGLTTLAGAATAQTPAPAGQTASATLEDVIVTGAPFGVTDRASLLAVDVLDEEDLAVAPSVTLGDLVSGLPGVRSTSFAPGASRPVIRGLAGPRVQVLTNGLGMIDASSVSPDHQVAVDPAEARRIEIVRGPSTLVFGGSAIGGVVNIIDDRIPEEPAEGGFDGHVSAQHSTVDDGTSLGARLKVNAGPLVLTVDGFTRDASDYAVPVFPESRVLLEAEGEEPAEDRTVANTFVRLDQYGAGASWTGPRGYLGASVKQVDTTYGVPGHGHEEEAGGGEAAEESVSIGLEQTRYDVRGELRFDAGPFSSARLAAGHADYRHTEFEGEEVGTQFFSDGSEGRLELVQRERNGWQGVVGMQALERTFDAVGDEAYVPRTEIAEQGFFTVQRFDRGAFGLEGGLRVD